MTSPTYHLGLGGSTAQCKCRCRAYVSGDCDHVWDGPVVDEPEQGINTLSCSRCGQWKINHDVWADY